MFGSDPDGGNPLDGDEVGLTSNILGDEISYMCDFFSKRQGEEGFKKERK